MPELLARFGSRHTVEGSETTTDLTYRFRLKDFTVDVGLVRGPNGLASTLEAYYSTKSLQADGQAPTGIVRGIMNVTAPRAKWVEATPVSPQLSAFKTEDGAFEAAVLPPNPSVEPRATFTLVVCQLAESNSGRLAESQALAGNKAHESQDDDVHHPTNAATGPRPIFRIHVNSSFIQVLWGKSRKEIEASLGWPAENDEQSYTYTARVPALFGETDGFLIVYFARDKARAFQLVSTLPADRNFIQVALQNFPNARFEPTYEPKNLTGSNWQDKANGFSAFTSQMSEKEFLVTFELTPWKERSFSPFTKQQKSR